jgi:hypothetical protein
MMVFTAVNAEDAEDEPAIPRAHRMRALYGLTVAICLLFTSTGRASDEQAIALDQVPKPAVETMREFFPEAELLQATKLVENGKECYLVTFRDRERVRSYYVRPDGSALLLKEEVFSFADATRWLLGGGLLLLLPGVIAGVITRWLAQVGQSNQLSVPAEWLAAWIGGVFIIGILLAAITTFREKDWLVIGLKCAVWGAAAASIVQLLGLVVQSIRGSRASCRRWILGLSCAAVVFLLLTIPVDMLWKHRSNQHNLALALRAPSS